jgi:hypothetical protein
MDSSTTSYIKQRKDDALSVILVKEFNKKGIFPRAVSD